MSILMLALNTCHFQVLALFLGGAFSFCFLGSLLLGFISTVFFLIRNKVGLRLFRGELGGCRGLRVPNGNIIRIFLGRVTKGTLYLPFDGESGHTWFLSEDVTLHSLDDWLGRGLRIELF